MCARQKAVTTDLGAEHCPTWAIAVFAARESAKILTATVQSAIRACSGRPVVVDLLVNGNPALAGNITTQLDNTIEDYHGDVRIRVWEIDAADKANAWNRYVHEIWPNADVSFFVDGYAWVKPDALSALAEALRVAGERVWAATGVPTRGRSAVTLRTAMIRDHELHGNLYALPRRVVAALRNHGFQLPLGLYRTDGFLGAALKFALDPGKEAWEPGRILVCAGATWGYEPLAWRSFRDLLTHLRRRFRQAQGRLENAAVRQHWAVERNGISSLPGTGRALISNWVQRHPISAFAVCLRDPVCLLAARTSLHPHDWPAADTAPRLVTERARARSR
jgi:hypothetical protein